MIAQLYIQANNGESETSFSEKGAKKWALNKTIQSFKKRLINSTSLSLAAYIPLDSQIVPNSYVEAISVN